MFSFILQVSAKSLESMSDEGKERNCEEDHFLYTQVRSIFLLFLSTPLFADMHLLLLMEQRFLS